MQLLIGHGQVPTIMPEASNFDMFIQKIKDDEAEVAKLAKSPTPTSSGGLQEAPQGAFNTCAPERRVSQALLLATAKSGSFTIFFS